MKRPCSGALALLVLLTTGGARAASYYAAPSGNDSNPGTEAAPFKTLAKGASVLAPGDTLFARAGTYAEEFYNGIPGGTSWTQPVTLANYPGEKPVIQPPPGAGRVFSFASSNVSYVVVEGFVLDAKNTQYDAVKVTWGSDGASHHIRIKSCEVMGSPGQGILLTGESGKNGLDVTGNEFIDLDVHDNGTTDFDHGFYISTAGNLVDGCRVHANAGWGIHVYNGSANDADQNVIRNNRSYDNARVGNRGVGIGIYSGSGTLAYNNLIWGNKTGIALNYAADGAEVYNNVVFGNLEGGIDIGPESAGARIKNNVVWQNGTGINDAGSGSVADANVVDIDPSFVDETKQDFHPKPGSPLIDEGVTVAEVAVDIEGVTRPQGSAYDVGAYEYCPSGCAAAGAGGASAGGTGGAAGSAGSAAGSTSGGSSAGGSSAGGSPASGGAKHDAAGDSGGCGCHTAPARLSALGWLGLLLFATRRRRPRAAG